MIHPEPSGPTHRSDIDGLRAVAILCVLLFHAVPHRFPGGYVGVDVFFVISGFVITKLLLGALTAGRFSFADFFARRLRRIAPALILVCLACLAVGWFLLLPDEYAQLGEHVAGAAASVSNLILWGEAGYFDNESATKPLLHLWSLGVEIQFYALWPVAMAFLARSKKAHAPAAGVAVLGLLSFAIGLAALERSSVAAFYFPFGRFWELILGGWLACLVSGEKAGRVISDWNRSSVRSTLTSLVGLVLILWSSRMRGDRADFPGWAAVPPTLGALLVILAGPTAWPNRVVLSSKAMVLVGLISYPLYLWHWPILVFTRIAAAGQPSLPQRCALVGASVVLAGLTYRLVETPVRRARGRLSRSSWIAAALVLTGLAGLLIFVKAGIPSRVGDSTAAADLSAGPFLTLRGRQTLCPPGIKGGLDVNCRLSAPGAPGFVLLGDSHAHHLLAGISELDRDRVWLMLNDAACPPVSGVSVSLNQRHGCGAASEASLAFVLGEPALRTVALSSFAAYVNEPGLKDQVQPTATTITSAAFPSRDPRELLFLGLDRTVSRLEESGKAVILIHDVPELPFFPRDCVRRDWMGLPDRCSLARETALKRQAAYRNILRRIAERHPSARLFDPYDALCPAQTCSYRSGGHLLYSDSHHLTTHGSALVSKAFLEWLAKSSPS